VAPKGYQISLCLRLYGPCRAKPFFDVDPGRRSRTRFAPGWYGYPFQGTVMRFSSLDSFPGEFVTQSGFALPGRCADRILGWQMGDRVWLGCRELASLRGAVKRLRLWRTGDLSRCARGIAGVERLWRYSIRGSRRLALPEFEAQTFLGGCGRFVRLVGSHGLKSMLRVYSSCAGSICGRYPEIDGSRSVKSIVV
jgi:hypothetical protein